MPPAKKQKRTTKKTTPKKAAPRRRVASAKKRPAKKRVAKRTALPVHPVSRIEREKPKQHPFRFRLLSLVLLLLASLTNTGVVLAANRDSRNADLRARASLQQLTPREYLYQRASEKNLDFRLLERIAFCESNWRMVKSSQSSAYGFFQIIDATERSTPQYKEGERKFDPFTNIDMAVYLFERYGSTPWTESRPCWWWYE